jgi:hypothetical protein
MLKNINEIISNFKSEKVIIRLSAGDVLVTSKNSINICVDGMSNTVWVSCKDSKDNSVLYKLDNIIGFSEKIYEAPKEYVKPVIDSSFVNEPINNEKGYSFTRRIANNITKNLDEGKSFNNNAYKDPIEKVKELAKRKIEENNKLKESISSHMSNSELSEVKLNYAVPSFKKRP